MRPFQGVSANPSSARWAHGGVGRRGDEGGHPDRSAGGTSAPWFLRNHYRGRISERFRGVDVIWMEQVTLEKEKILNKAKARQAPSFQCGWRGFICGKSDFSRIVFRSDSSSWPPYRTIDLDGPQCKPFIFDAARPHLQRRRRCRTSSYRPR